MSEFIPIKTFQFQIKQKVAHVPKTIHNKIRAGERSVLFSTSRNGGCGAILGTLIILSQLRKEKINPDLRKRDVFWKIIKQWFKNISIYPLHVIIFTVSFKLLTRIGRMLVGLRNLESSGRRKVPRRMAVALTAFLSGYAAEYCSPAWNWSILLYAWLRALVAFIQLNRILLQVDPLKLYFFIHAMLPFFITFTARWIPKSYYLFFKSLCNADMDSYIKMYDPKGDLKNKEPIEQRGGVISSCKKVLKHVQCSSRLRLKSCYPIYHSNPSCIKSFFADGMVRLKLSALFYMKLYAVMTVTGGIPRLKKIRKRPIHFVRGLIMKSLQSATFLSMGFHIPERFHCYYRWVLGKLGYKKVKNNIWAFLVFSGIIGNLVVRLEPPNRRPDLILWTVWKMVDQVCRYMTDTQYGEKPGGFILSPHFTCVGFATTCALWSFAYSTNPNSLRKLDRTIISTVLS